MLAVAIFFIILSGLIILPFSIRYVIAFWTSIFQFYTLSALGFYPSVTLLANASLAPTLISLRRSLLQGPVVCLLGLFVLQTISLIWSPDRHFGFTTILYEAPFLLMYLAAFHLAQSQPNKLLIVIKIYALLSLLPLLFIIVFALMPQLNLFYVKSPLAHFFNHPHAVQWYIEGYPGELWAGKPRGIIFDPNAAGGYLGICALVFYGIGIYCHSKWLKGIAVLHGIGIFFTAVVAAMFFAVIFLLALTTFYLYTETKIVNGLSFKKICLGLSGLLMMGMITIYFIYPGVVSFFIDKFSSRPILWKLAFIPLSHHPFIGLGFGGLEKIYANFYPLALDKPMYRPHNTLIALWAQSGFLAALLGLAFIGSVLFSCWRAFRKAVQKPHRYFVLLISYAILWMFLHAMGENWGIVGEIHAQPLIATVYALMMGLYTCNESFLDAQNINVAPDGYIIKKEV